MTVVSLNLGPQGASKRSQIGNAIKLFLFTFFVGLTFYRTIDLKTVGFVVTNATFVRFVDFLLGAILGATMAHFVIDAGAWRLSQTLQRVYIGHRYAFLFRRPSKSSCDAEPG